MKTIELIGLVDEQQRLSLDVPAGVPPGPVKVLLAIPTNDDDDALAWSQAVGQAWAADWSDPREDLYTLEDGQPE